jgi:hypothetical protein
MPRVRPGSYTLRVPQRATLEESITLKVSGEPLNLTGYTVLAQIWKDEKRRIKIADLTVIYVSRTLGQIQLTLSRSQTRQITKDGYWDLLVIEPSGSADYWLEGEAILDIGLTDNVT